MLDTKQILKQFEQAEDKQGFVRELRELAHTLSPQKAHPVDCVRWVPVEQVHANDYNPNSVARNEMRLLKVSVQADGYTQPVVTVYDKDTDKYVIVDGFHRYTIMRLNQDIREATGGYLPVVVIDKPIEDRMASTVRHNRARGKHSVAGMANIVFSMLDKGMTDEEVCNELGMTVDELVRIKHVSGFSKLFENVEYQAAWESRKQLMHRKEWQDKARESKEKA